jgi:molybdopterin-guanine dinucleotide biosynthesis protein A
MVGGLVLAGGAGRRMGGVDKAALVVGGLSLLDRVLTAARPVCDRLVVVGPLRPTTVAGVAFVVEAAPAGGPVPAVACGLASLPDCAVVLVLAADLPLLTAAHLQALLDAVGEPEVGAAAAADVRGPNPLLAAYRAGALAGRVAELGDGVGAPAGRMLPPATAAVELGAATLNVNRPADLAEAERLLAG